MARRAAHLTIGQLSERSGVATSALRYYEDLGLIGSERTAGNQRRYLQPTLRRVAFIRAAQRVGLSLVADEHGFGFAAGDAAIVVAWLDPLQDGQVPVTTYRYGDARPD